MNPTLNTLLQATTAQAREAILRGNNVPGVIRNLCFWYHLHPQSPSRSAFTAEEMNLLTAEFTRRFCRADFAIDWLEVERALAGLEGETLNANCPKCGMDLAPYGFTR